MVGGGGICSYFVLPKSMRRLRDSRGYSGTFFFRRKKRNKSMMISKMRLRTNSNMVLHPFGGAMDAMLPGHGPFSVDVISRTPYPRASVLVESEPKL